MRLERTIGACALLAVVAACAPRELILEGERMNLRTEESAADAADAARPISLPAATRNADWPQTARGPGHDIGHVALAAAPQRIWSADIGAGDGRRHRITADPVVAGGRVFTVDSRATVTAHSTSGARLWSVDLTPPSDAPDDASGAGLAVADGRLFVSTAFGYLVALDPATGREIWSQDLDASAPGAPAARGGLVYVVSRDGRGWAVDSASGRVRWTLQGTPSEIGVTGGATPAVSDRAVLFPFASGELVSALREGGLQLWVGRVAGERQGRVFAKYTDISGDPVISGGRIYVGNSGGRTVALDLSSGEPLWTAREGSLSPVAVAGGSLFLISDLDELVRLDAETGERIWGTRLPLFVNERTKRREAIFEEYGPVLAGGQLWVASSDGALRAYDPVDGSLTREVPLPGGAATSPVVANGVLYVVSGQGQLHAFR